MPPIPLSFSSLRPQTSGNLVLDAGKAYLNIDADYFRATGDWVGATNPTNGFTSANGGTVYPTPLGATRGGVSLSVGKTERQIQVDGVRVPVKGLDRVDMIAPYIQLQLLEMGSVDQLKATLGSTSVQDHPLYKEITPTLLVADTDFYDNLAILATVSGQTDPIVVLLDHPRVVEIGEMKLEDKNEMVAQAKFMGHATLTDPTAVPIHFFEPITFSS